MYERAYHPKDLDAPAKFAPTLKMRKGNAQYRRGQQYIRMVEVPRIEYLHQSKELIHLLSVFLSLLKRITKESSTLRGVYGGLFIPAHPRPMIREGTLLQPRKDQDPLSSQSSQLIFVVFENKHVEPKYDTYH